MGNNQSTQRKDEAGSSSFLACCGCGSESSDGSDARNTLGNAQDMAQPHTRPSMSAANPGRPASRGHALQHKPSQASTAPLRPPTRHRSDASKRSRPSIDSKSKGLRKARQDQSRSQSAELMPLELPKLLPKQKRLSPLPDFTSFLSAEMGNLSQQPWLAVRTMAEKMPSRRSSVLTAQEHAMSEESRQRLASMSGRSTPRSPLFGPASPRHRSPLSVSGIGRIDSGDRVVSPKPTATPGLECSKSTPYPTVHLKTTVDLPKNEPLPRSLQPIIYVRTLSDDESSFSTRVIPGPARPPSPHLTQRKPSVNNGFTILGRKTSLTGTHNKQDVEEDVRELQTFVEAKREITNQPATLQRSDSAAQRLEDAKKHRPAIAPGMLVGGSSALLGDIGSAFSRSTSEGPMTVQHRSDLQRTPSDSRPPSSFPKRLPKWIQSRTSEEGSPRHSGTFFVTSRLSRNDSTSGTNEVQPSANTPVSLAPKRDESPVDKHWTPPKADQSPAPASTKDRSKRPAVPEKDSVKPGEQHTPLIARRKRSSTVGDLNPATHLSVITGSETSSPSDYKSRSGRSFSTTPTTDSPITPARVSSRSQSRSRTDKSLAVQAARTRALTRTQSHEAMNDRALGLGIGGLGRAKADMVLNIVDIDKMQPQPRSSSLRKKNEKPERSSSTIANPSNSPVDTSAASPPPQVRHIAAQQVARAVVVPASGPETESKEKPRVVVRQLSAAKQHQEQKEKALAGHGVNIVRPPRSSSNIKPVTDVTQAGTTTPVLEQPRPVAIDEITVTTTPPPPPPYETRPKLRRPGMSSTAAAATTRKVDSAKPTGYRSRTNSRSQSMSQELPPTPPRPTPPSMPRKPVAAQLPPGDATRDRPAHVRTKSQLDDAQVRRRPVHARTRSTPHANEALHSANSDAIPSLPQIDATKPEANAGEQQLRGRALSQTKRGRTRTPTRRQRSQPARITSMSPEERQSRERETRKRDFEMDVKRSASARRLREVEAELRRVEGELANLGFGIGGGQAGEGGAGVGVAF